MPANRFVILCGASMLSVGAAQCPAGGLPMHDRCWYLGDIGASCSETCQAKGLSFSHFVVGEGSPMVPRLLGKDPSTRQFPWARLECYVTGSDRYHTSKEKPDSNAGDSADPGSWKVEVCRLSCPCGRGEGAPAPPVNAGAPYPHCMEQNTVFRHAGAHAIFVDLTTYGHSGCWQNDCKNTDKFNAVDIGICARTCNQTPDCMYWSYGEQEDAKKCFMRKADGGREIADGWVSAAKGCAPPALPDAFVAMTAAKLLEPCDAGKSPQCPDMAQAINTWRFAIRHLKKAAEGKVDPNTINFINQVSDDTDAFASQMSEDNFPVVVSNNRQVFIALQSWVESQPQVAIDPKDASLPNPLLGKLCGASSCFEKTAL